MAYGELVGEALEWATQFQFGIDPSSLPSRVVITPLKVEEYFENFPAIIAKKRLTSERIGSSFLVCKDDRHVLFCQGGIGASNFADSSYTLCHCENVEEMIFVGTGGGLGEDVKSADITIPTSCIRLDKVLDMLLPPEACAKVDLDMVRKMRSLIESEVQPLGVKVYEGIHATVPFFLAETKQLLIDLQKQGVLSVDMELSVLYALANHYHKKAMGIIRIGDLPLRGLPTWKSRSYQVELKKEVHKRILYALIKYLFA